MIKNERLSTKLYEKMFAEQEKYRNWLRTLPHAEILNHANEYVMREEIILTLEYHDLTDGQVKEPEKNKVLPQYVQIGLDGHKHRRNLNTMVIGVSGAGKTRFYAKPNICQANTSFVVQDRDLTHQKRNFTSRCIQ